MTRLIQLQDTHSPERTASSLNTSRAGHGRRHRLRLWGCPRRHGACSPSLPTHTRPALMTPIHGRVTGRAKETLTARSVTWACYDSSASRGLADLCQATDNLGTVLGRMLLHWGQVLERGSVYISTTVPHRDTKTRPPLPITIGAHHGKVKSTHHRTRSCFTIRHLPGCLLL